jgi:hypothetical protein
VTKRRSGSLLQATYLNTYDEQMGSITFGASTPAPAGLVTPRDIEINRGRSGCVRVSDRI